MSTVFCSIQDYSSCDLSLQLCTKPHMGRFVFKPAIVCVTELRLIILFKSQVSVGICQITRDVSKLGFIMCIPFPKLLLQCVMCFHPKQNNANFPASRGDPVHPSINAAKGV